MLNGGQIILRKLLIALKECKMVDFLRRVVHERRWWLVATHHRSVVLDVKCDPPLQHRAAAAMNVQCLGSAAAVSSVSTPRQFSSASSVMT